MYKAVVFDVDGTLVYSQKGYVPQSTVQAIHLLQEKGYVVLIATGRPLFSAPIVDAANIKPDFYIGSNGHCVSKSDGTIIYDQQIDNKTYLSITEYCRENDINLFWKYHEWIYGAYVNEMGRESTKLYTNYSDGLLPQDSLPNAACIICDKKQYQNIKETFKDKVDMCDGGWLVYDINKKGVSKIDGLKAACAYLNISLKECVGFGDSENDLEMIKACGLGICMGNGQQVLKDNCDYITDNVQDDGIYNALKKFELI